MSFSVPTQIIVYLLGILVVIFVAGLLTWGLMRLEKWFNRRREQRAARREQ
jgi:hypothetical protein